MEKTITTMVQVCDAQELKALEGCTITSITGGDGYRGEGLFLHCKNETGNRVDFLISEDESWHLYDSKMEGITAEQYGEIAMLADCQDIDFVHFHGMAPIIEIIIKPIGSSAADHVLATLRGIFPRLEVEETKWDFEGEQHPMYLCGDQNYYFTITVAVMPLDTIRDIRGV